MVVRDVWNGGRRGKNFSPRCAMCTQFGPIRCYPAPWLFICLRAQYTTWRPRPRSRGLARWGFVVLALVVAVVVLAEEATTLQLNRGEEEEGGCEEPRRVKLAACWCGVGWPLFSLKEFWGFCVFFLQRVYEWIFLTIFSRNLQLNRGAHLWVEY